MVAADGDPAAEAAAAAAEAALVPAGVGPDTQLTADRYQVHVVLPYAPGTTLQPPAGALRAAPRVPVSETQDLLGPGAVGSFLSATTSFSYYRRCSTQRVGHLKFIVQTSALASHGLPRRLPARDQPIPEQ